MRKFQENRIRIGEVIRGFRQAYSASFISIESPEHYLYHVYQEDKYHPLHLSIRLRKTIPVTVSTRFNAPAYYFKFGIVDQAFIWHGSSLEFFLASVAWRSTQLVRERETSARAARSKARRGAEDEKRSYFLLFCPPRCFTSRSSRARFLAPSLTD